MKVKNKVAQNSISSDILSFSSSSENVRSFPRIPSVSDNTEERNRPSVSMNTSSNIFSPKTKTPIKPENKSNQTYDDKTEVLDEISEYESSTFNKIKNKMNLLLFFR